MDDVPSNIKIEVIKIFPNGDSESRLALKLTVANKGIGNPEVYLFDLNRILNGESQLIKDDRDSDAKENYAILYHSLTKREQQVLVMVAKGATSTEIAETLFIAVNTVKNHRRNIKQKLGLHDSILYSKFLRWVQTHMNSN